MLRRATKGPLRGRHLPEGAATTGQRAQRLELSIGSRLSPAPLSARTLQSVGFRQPPITGETRRAEPPSNTAYPSPSTPPWRSPSPIPAKVLITARIANNPKTDSLKHPAATSVGHNDYKHAF